MQETKYARNRITKHSESVITLMLNSVVVFVMVSFSMNSAHGQGIVAANWPWINVGFAHAVSWQEAGLVLRVIPQPPLTQNPIAHVGAWTPGYPTNGTPKLAFQQTEGNPDYVIFAHTNNVPFGLVSIDLADPVAPSPAPIDITFNGFKADGSMVSQTFTVGGGGSSSFQTFYFGPDFAHGLLRVEIPSPAWAMDNLVWVPEPSTYALLGLGLVAFTLRRIHKRRRL